MIRVLFVYGTLGDPAVQLKLIGRVVSGESGRLPGYRVSEIEINGEKYPLAVPDAVGGVSGSVLEVTPEELATLDEYETDAYRREEVTLTDGRKVWAYLRNDYADKDVATRRLRPSMRIILGSSSRWRRQIVVEMGYEFETMSPDVDEKAIRRDDPAELVAAIAQAKSEALLPRIAGPALLITSDQVVTAGNRILEKPRDEAEAREYIRLSGEHPVSTVTAVRVVNTATGRVAEGVDVVEIVMRPMPEAVIDQIIAKGDVYTCAGGLNLEEPLAAPYVVAVHGGLDSVIGLPKKLTKRLIDEVIGGQ